MSGWTEQDGDVPSPIDLREVTDAAAWVVAADVKRPWRVEVRSHIAALCGTLPGPLRVLELGPGPGLLAEAILCACAVERYTLLDFSAPMLEMSRDRLAGFAAVELVQGDFTRPDWAAALAPPFDAVVTMQAAHEVRHKRHLPRLYAQVHAVLRPGGLLIVADHEPFEAARSRALHARVDEQQAALAAAGFTDVVVHATHRGLYLCSGTR